MNSRAKLFSFDNFQIGQEVKDQRGEHSSAFFKGTNEGAHKVHGYNDTKFDATMVVDVTRLDNQALPSPPIMVPYEDAPLNHCLGDYILQHSSMEGVSITNVTVARVRRYGRVLCLTYMNTILSRVFS